MTTLANTLYITTQGAYVRREHETLQVKIDGAVIQGIRTRSSVK